MHGLICVVNQQSICLAWVRQLKGNPGGEQGNAQHRKRGTADLDQNRNANTIPKGLLTLLLCLDVKWSPFTTVSTPMFAQRRYRLRRKVLLFEIESLDWCTTSQRLNTPESYLQETPPPSPNNAAVAQATMQRSYAPPGPHLRSESILRGDHLTGRYVSFGGPIRHVFQGRSIQGAFCKAISRRG